MSFLKETLGNLKRERQDIEEGLATELNGHQDFNYDDDDPLMMEMEIPKCEMFVGEFNENGLLSFNHDDEDVKVPVKKKGPGRPKKIRLEDSKPKETSNHEQSWTAVRPNSIENDCVAEVVEAKCKGPASTVDDPIQAWSLIMDEHILMDIVKATNEKIKRNKRTKATEKNLTIVELRAYLGLCYACGVFRHTPSLCGPLDELWTMELGNTVFRATMSLKRFQFISDSLSFSVEKSQKGLRQRPLEPIESIWERFITNCRSFYAPSTHCNVEEHLIPTTDISCPFLYKLRPEDEERGLRIVTVSDAKTLYICNAFIADGNRAKKSDVQQILGDILATRRVVVLCERYTSIALVKQLAAQEMAAVGPLSHDSEDIPIGIVTGTHKRLYSDSLAMVNCGKHTLLASTPARVNAQELYERTQQNGQRAHKTARTFTTSNSALSIAQRWPLQFFYAILDYAAHNAWLLLRLSDKGSPNITQRDFQRMLGLHLTQPHLRSRLHRSNNNLTLNLKLQISEMLGESTDKLLADANSRATKSVVTISSSNLAIPDNITFVSKHHIGRARCRDCPKPCNNKTRLRCQQCSRVMCGRHLISRCGSCMGVEIPEGLQLDDAVCNE